MTNQNDRKAKQKHITYLGIFLLRKAWYHADCISAWNGFALNYTFNIFKKIIEVNI